jgi:pimeloyl-ACP methyl ester carboxylesterase
MLHRSRLWHLFQDAVRRFSMPKINANGITINYEQQGTGEPLILIPFLSADNACYAFQVAEYAKHFTCISLDLRGTGESDKPDGDVSIELYADDVAAFMQALGIAQAHVSGLSLGAAIGLWLAAKHPDKVKSLSLHSGWAKSDEYQKAIVEGWQAAAKGLNNVTEMVIRSVFPWCFTPELYTAKFDYVQQLVAFLRSRPAMSVDDFIRQSNAVIAHDVEGQLANITAPTQITFGRHDQLTSLRFADPLKNGIRDTELVVFEDCSHAPIYENVEQFNQKTLEFLKRKSQTMSASV